MKKSLLIITAILATFSLSSAFSANGEKLLIGFEKNEMAKINSSFNKRFLKSKSKWFPSGAAEGEATQGTSSLKIDISARWIMSGLSPKSRRGTGGDKLFKTMPWSRTLRPANIIHDFFNTWFTKGAVENDWSGYDYLLLDVKSTKADGVLQVAFEDEVICPPIRLNFKIPAGKWVTLQIDLKKCVETRKIDLKKIINFWFFLVEMSEVSTLYIDNMRLAGKGFKAGKDIVDAETYEEKIPRAYQVPVDFSYTRNKFHKSGADYNVPKLPPFYSGKADRSPVKLSKKPIKIDLSSAHKFGRLMPQTPITIMHKTRVAAYDNNNILVSYGLNPVKAITTTDGGKTWKGLDGTANAGNIVTAGGSAVSGDGATFGGDLLMVTSVGCCGYGYPADRLFFRRVAFTGKGWEASNLIYLECDIRHCARPKPHCCIKLKSGRLWAVWGNYGRNVITGIHVKYSDDGGAVWHSWHGEDGKISAVPGTYDDKNCNAPYGRVAYLTPYGEHFACLYTNKSGAVMSIFDGKGWSKPSVIEGGYTKPARVITVGEKDVYVLCKDTVKSWNGSAWKKENVKAAMGKTAMSSEFAVSGNKLYLFSIEGKNKIVYYEKNKGGGWTGPKTLVSSDKPITGISVQQYSPENFVPVVWACEDGKGRKVTTEGFLNMLLLPTK